MSVGGGGSSSSSSSLPPPDSLGGAAASPSPPPDAQGLDLASMPVADAAERDELRSDAALIADAAAGALDLLLGFGAADRTASGADGSALDPYRNAPAAPQDGFGAYRSDAQPASWPNGDAGSVQGWYDERGSYKGAGGPEAQNASYPNANGAPTTADVRDSSGNLTGWVVTDTDGRKYFEPADGSGTYYEIPTPLTFEPAYIQPSRSAPTAAQAPSVPSDPLPQQDLPPLPPPDLPPLPPPSPDGSAQEVAETVIVGETPYATDVSDPETLRRVEGQGHIERGDVEQFGRGAYNGLLEIAPTLLGPLFGAALKAADPPKADIDTRYGGAAIVGDQLTQNLALEAAGALPGLGRAGKAAEELPALAEEFNSAVPREAPLTAAPRAPRGVKVEYVGKSWANPFARGGRFQRWATGSANEHVFKITRNGKETLVYADNFVDDFLVEAKDRDFYTFTDDAIMSNPKVMEDANRVYTQAKNYLTVSNKLGLRGVRYAVSDAQGVERLQKLFAAAFPEAVASGELSVWFVPP